MSLESNRTHKDTGSRSSRTLTTLTVALGAALALSAAAWADSDDDDNDSKRRSEGKSSSKLETGKAVAARVQSKARPFGLDIAAPVMAAGSDAASTDFQKNVLPGIDDLLNAKLGERLTLGDAGMLLDPSKLALKTSSDVRVYFVGEGAGYHNTLGFNTQGGGVKSGDPLLIFPDASSSISAVGGSNEGRTSQLPLLPGDFVDLGTFKEGTKLDFFLIADGANKGTSTYSTDQSVNPDGINHVVAFSYAMKGSPYLIIGFEDLYGGGDRDFNDVLFALDIGAANVAALLATPEPTLALTLFSLVGIVGWTKLRRERSVMATV